MNQNAINDKICRMATAAAMNGTSLETVQWYPPQTAASDPDGIFVVKYAEKYSASQTPPWLR